MRGVYAVALCITAMVAALKLSGAIDWSWWWIAAPIWMAIGIAIREYFGN